MNDKIDKMFLMLGEIIKSYRDIAEDMRCSRSYDAHLFILKQQQKMFEKILDDKN